MKILLQLLVKLTFLHARYLQGIVKVIFLARKAQAFIIHNSSMHIDYCYLFRWILIEKSIKQSLVYTRAETNIQISYGLQHCYDYLLRSTVYHAHTSVLEWYNVGHRTDFFYSGQHLRSLFSSGSTFPMGVFISRPNKLQ